MNRRPPKKGKRVEETNTLLVDGNALFKVGYHGAINEYNRQGEHIGGIYQFITVLRRLLTDNIYQQVYVFWDGEFSGKLRYEIYPDYKSGRGKDYINGTKPDDINQIQERFIIHGYLEDLFIRQIADEHIVEGDDYIAYYSKTKAPNERVTIVTNDRDLCQLIEEDVQIFLVDKKSYVTSYNFNSYAGDGVKKVNIFNFHRDNVVLVKTICGDSSDSIRGVKGVGEKTLFKNFPEIVKRSVSLQEIVDRAKELQDDRITNNKPPLKAFTNLIEGITTDKEGKKEIKMGMALYERNHTIVDLSSPMMTNEAIRKLTDLMGATINPEGRGIKEAYIKMKRDGLDVKVGNIGIEYLMPFKKLIEREKKEFIKENKL